MIRRALRWLRATIDGPRLDVELARAARDANELFPLLSTGQIIGNNRQIALLAAASSYAGMSTITSSRGESIISTAERLLVWLDAPAGCSLCDHGGAQ